MLHTVLFDLKVALVFVAMLIVLVFAHEFGHYIFARLFGMGVEEFAIGFGKPRLGIYYRRKYKIPLTEAEADLWENGELRQAPPEGLPAALEPATTEYGDLVRSPEGSYLDETTRFTVRAWPLGGFVRIRGQMPEEQGREVHIPGGFYSKAPWKRLIVLFAGPVFSVLTGILILMPYLMIVGKPIPEQKPVFGAVLLEGRAGLAGLKEGDRVVSIDGATITNFYQVITTVRSHAEQPLSFVVNRDGKDMTLTVTPLKDTEPSPVLGPDLEPTDALEIQGKLGVAPVSKIVPQAFVAASREAISMPLDVIASLAKSVLHPSRFKDEVGGPVTIVHATSDATKAGVNSVVVMAATLSISLGIFNLLPIYPLDGGQMLVSFAELFRRGRRISMKAQNVVAAMGLSALFMLVISVLFIDFQRMRPSTPAKPAAPEAAKK